MIEKWGREIERAKKKRSEGKKCVLIKKKNPDDKQKKNMRERN